MESRITCLGASCRNRAVHYSCSWSSRAEGRFREVDSVEIKRAGVFVQGAMKVRGRLWRFTLNRNRWTRIPIAIPDYGNIQSWKTINTSSVDNTGLLYLRELSASDNSV